MASILLNHLPPPWRELPESHRRVAQMAAIHGLPISKTRLLSLCHRAGLRGPRGILLRSGEWDELRTRLVHAGVLIEDQWLPPQNLIEPLVRLAVIEEYFPIALAAIKAEEGSFLNEYNMFGVPRCTDQQRLVRNVRLLIYLRAHTTITEILSSKSVSLAAYMAAIDPLAAVFGNPWDPAWTSAWCPDGYHVADLACRILAEDTRWWRFQPGVLASVMAQGTPTDDLALTALVDLALLRQDAALFERLGTLPPPYPQLTAAVQMAAAGQDDAALECLDRVVAVRGTTSGDFPRLARLFSVLLPLMCRLRRNRSNDQIAFDNLVSNLSRRPQFPVRQAVGFLRQAAVAQRQRQQVTGLLPTTDLPPWAVLVLGMIGVWSECPVDPSFLSHLTALNQRAEQNGLVWAVLQTRDLLDRLQHRPGQPSQGCMLLSQVLRQQQPWESCLEVLSHLNTIQPEDQPTTTPAGPDRRLAWRLRLPERHEEELPWVEVAPIDQRRLQDGRWSKGRPVALKRLIADEGDLPPMDDLDRKLLKAATIVRHSWGYHRQEYLHIDPDRAWEHLIGHPRLFNAEDEEPLTVIEVQPVVRLRPEGDSALLELVPAVNAKSRHWLARQVGSDRIEVIRVAGAVRILSESLGTQGTIFPQTIVPKVQELLAQLARKGAIHLEGQESALVQPGQARPWLDLVPTSEGLAGRLHVLPAGEAGPSCRPGQGAATLVVRDASGERRIRRDLVAEREQAEALIPASPALAAGRIDSHAFRWDGLETCLELLAQLPDLAVGVRWPEGRPFSLAGRAGLERLRLHARAGQDWFEVGGGLEVDESLTIELRQLLTAWSDHAGRFVALGENRFLALSESLRRRLEDLAALAELRDGSVRLHPLAAGQIASDDDQQRTITGDKAWQQLRQRVVGAEQVDTTLPSGFTGELRPYQQDGFAWMCRLAQWGAGACLADDMGLGKTVQSLALLMRRAPLGPALVLAPLTVCANWISESARFTPTLRVRFLADHDRAALLAEAGPGDVIITSYGLLVNESEALTAVTWATLILDEAQAIKNAETKRAQAALRLSAGFRLITTGTPVENHLGELWTLFHFLNPGLLGSQTAFRERFATAIEAGSPIARTALQRRVRPFILRRTKAAVLAELPSRTEIALRIGLSAPERAFYEAIRREALASLEAGGGPQQRFTVLAHLMKLRRAACHPRLVLPDSPLESSKLAQFLDTLAELRDGGHRALVFSQFTDHLALVGAALDRQGITYQYLDGSTPARDRSAAVAAFQAGQGDCFLISLRAGGSGLNLTAADYVIHLDPWWNPAVEDQASDRAHRIGQTRPVTIYRLIATGTVEEAILDLHHRKRDLAEAILAGADAGARLDLEGLVALLRDEGLAQTLPAPQRGL